MEKDIKDDGLSPVDLLEIQEDELSELQPIGTDRDGFYENYWSDEN